MTGGLAIDTASPFGNGTLHHKASGSISLGTPTGAIHEDDDEDLCFDSPKEEAAYYRDKYRVAVDLLNETRAELDEFQVSSRELEQELEKELEATEAKQNELRDRIQRLEVEKDEWKTKFVNLQKMHSSTVSAMQREMDNLRSERDKTLVAIRDLEMGNDELERNERVAASSLLDVEIRYNRAIEEKTLLEQEVVQRQELEEECQRLKDDVRDANNEIGILRDQLARLVVPTPPSSTGAPMSPLPERMAHSRSTSRSDAPSPTPTDRSTTTDRTDRSTTVTPSTVRPRHPPQSPRVGHRTALPVLSPTAKRTADFSSPSGIPALSRSTTSRTLTQPTASSARRAANSSNSSTATRAAHQVTKNKGFKLLHDLQARIKTTDDKIGKMVKKAPAQLAARRQPTPSTASSTSAAAAAAVGYANDTGTVAGRPRTTSSLAMTAATPRLAAASAEDASIGFLSPTSWVLLSEPEDTPLVSHMSRQQQHHRDEPSSPLDRNPPRAATTRANRGLPSRPAIPSPLVRETKTRPSLSASERPALASFSAGSTFRTHMRTSSRSGAVTPSTFIPRRTSVSVNGDNDCPSPPLSASTSTFGRSISSRPTSRTSSRGEDRPTARPGQSPATIRTRGDRPSHKSHGSHSGAISMASVHKALPTARRPARRSSMGVVEPAGLPPTGIPAPKSARPSSTFQASDTPPPPVPRIPSQVLRESKSRQEGRAKSPL